MELFRKMVETLSVSGNEEELAKLIEGEIAPYVDEITYDVMGNLIARKKGAPGAKKMMLSAHMDHIGFIVVAVEKEGYLRVMPVGGVKEKILAAKRAGITELILSEENRKDIAEIKPEYIAGLTFHYVKTNEEVLQLALE